MAIIYIKTTLYQGLQKALAGTARGPGASFVGREQVSPGVEYLDTW